MSAKSLGINGLKVDGKDEYETIKEVETLNSMVPLWKKNKSELKDEDYNKFAIEHPEEDKALYEKGD